ncbi:hypothetical protein LR48_Vigan05g011500 [Vigna angularis]|uniref:NAD-dependent epimerase/dehydratase domain-containing protein n=1 Tax=Phaseolus angularis TaxID=3914 RepID=A0A0L9UIK3_PHAAN|nr:hypothetical protein LR48_Vigan05g011500 [Vigna angularis]
MSTGAGKVACVTGASGYIASWLVKFLLQRGYTVKATVRDPNNPKKVDHLVNLDGAKERLQLFKADLLDEGSFDSAVQGCHAVFHTASPFFFGAKDPQAELLDPAVKGTLNVLKSCLKSATLKRVVVTSSVAAVACNDRPRAPDEVLDETWFSDAEFCRRNESNPGRVELTLIQVEPSPPRLRWVGLGQVELVQACSSKVKVESSQPRLKWRCVDDKPYPPAYQFSKERAKSLGLEFTPLEVSLKDTVESLREKGFAKF